MMCYSIIISLLHNACAKEKGLWEDGVDIIDAIERATFYNHGDELYHVLLHWLENKNIESPYDADPLFLTFRKVCYATLREITLF
jgi:hypothetical protein